MTTAKTLHTVSVDWQDVLDGSFPEPPVRIAYRDAVAEVAANAKAALPDCTGRIDKAVQIVLAGDVELLDDGRAKVASQSNGTTKYFVVNGACECPDFPRAPSGMCKHRIAYGIAKRAHTLGQHKLAVMLGETSAATPAPTPAPQALPEAPASCNVYVEVAGRKVQVTLRDSDEARLLSRLTALLTRFPLEQEAAEPPEGWCGIHNVQMKHHTNAKGSWWSHKTADGWCHGT